MAGGARAGCGELCAGASGVPLEYVCMVVSRFLGDLGLRVVVGAMVVVGAACGATADKPGAGAATATSGPRAATATGVSGAPAADATAAGPATAVAGTAPAGGATATSTSGTAPGGAVVPIEPLTLK